MFLIRRGNLFYFNRRIGERLLRFSLHINKRVIAQNRALRLSIFINRCKRKQMRYEDIKVLARRKAEELHDEWLTEHLNGKSSSRGQLIDEEEQDRLEDYDIKERLDTGEAKQDELVRLLGYSMFIQMKKETRKHWLNPALLLEATKDTQSPHTMQPSAVEPPRAPKVSELLEEFLADKKGNKSSITENTLENYRVTIRDFCEITGDKPVNTITYQDGTNYRNTLLKLPTHRTKKKIYKNKSIEQLTALSLPRESCMSSKTIEDHLSNLKGYFVWLKHTQRITNNPIEGVRIESTTNSYKEYTEDDLKRIFQSPLYTPDHSYRKSYGTRSHWWLIPLALHTGARISELCQLQLADVKEIEGVLCFSIDDEDPLVNTKQLKTKASRRITPVHPQLIVNGNVKLTH